MENFDAEKTCKNSPKCPIYSGVLKGMNFTASVYRQHYCDGGEAGWKKCKRYQVKELTGVCPENILPNSGKTVEEIARMYKLEFISR